MCFATTISNHTLIIWFSTGHNLALLANSFSLFLAKVLGFTLIMTCSLQVELVIKCSKVLNL